MVVFRKCYPKMLRSERERNSKTLELAEKKRASSYPQTLLSGFPRWRCAVLYLVAQSCLTLCDPMDCSLPGSSVHGILQARVLEWVAMPSSRVSSQPRDRTQVSHIAFFTIWATREVFSGAASGTELTCQCGRCKETWVWSLGWEDPLEEGIAIHSSILAWRVPRTEEPGGLQSMGLQRVRHDWSDLARTHCSVSALLAVSASFYLSPGWLFAAALWSVLRFCHEAERERV